ncbi:hypothetical protein [Rothia sp. (in: high G+C Gram-positive bacteria)]|uniref:hypothetical protein n=1 Tax=Rothia sp. (in: high G+C Gram-positive bacteria) TaxID=1885016 RepID=UPI0032164208
MSEQRILAEIELLTTSAKINVEAYHVCIRKGSIIRHHIQELQQQIEKAMVSDTEEMTTETWNKEAQLMKQFKSLQFEAEELLGEAEQDIRRAKALRDTFNS